MWLVPLKIVSNVSRFKPALNLNRGLADLNHGSNSLNSISGLTNLLLDVQFFNFPSDHQKSFTPVFLIQGLFFR